MVVLLTLFLGKIEGLLGLQEVLRYTPIKCTTNRLRLCHVMYNQIRDIYIDMKTFVDKNVTST